MEIKFKLFAQIFKCSDIVTTDKIIKTFRLIKEKEKYFYKILTDHFDNFILLLIKNP